MRGFRRAPGADHIVHALELPELTRRRRPATGGAPQPGAGSADSEPAGGPAASSAAERGRDLGRPERRIGGQGFGPSRDFPGSRPAFAGNGVGRVGDGPSARRPVPVGPERLTHGHRPEDGVPLREVEIPRPPSAPAKVLAEVVPSVPAAPSADSARIELLERRIAKLARLIEDQPAQLQLRSERSSSAPGIASVYAEVQGLKGDSEEAQRKRALMSSIFEANRKLRERIGSAAQDAE